MKHIHEQSNRDAGRSNLRGSDLDLVEAVEDHHNDAEAPEDHCRDQEGSGNLSRRPIRSSRPTP